MGSAICAPPPLPPPPLDLPTRGTPPLLVPFALPSNHTHHLKTREHSTRQHTEVTPSPAAHCRLAIHAAQRAPCISRLDARHGHSHSRLPNSYCQPTPPTQPRHMLLDGAPREAPSSCLCRSFGLSLRCVGLQQAPRARPMAPAERGLRATERAARFHAKHTALVGSTRSHAELGRARASLCGDHAEGTASLTQCAHRLASGAWKRRPSHSTVGGSAARGSEPSSCSGIRQRPHLRSTARRRRGHGEVAGRSRGGRRDGVLAWVRVHALILA